MRLAIITQDEPFFIPMALEDICSRRNDIIGMVILKPFNESLSATAWRLLDFYGPWDYLRLCVRFLRARLADVANRISPVTRPYSAADVARRHGISIYRPLDINSPDFVSVLRDEVKPDLLVSIAASQILKRCVLTIPAFGCINLHSAPLPRYQGMMPNFWMLLHQETEAAVTVHYMVEKLDAGDIIVQMPVPIDPKESLHDLMRRSKEIGMRAVGQAIEKIEQGRTDGRAMDISQASYFSFPKRADAMLLRAQGRRLL